ncbi:MAG: hypothetical protein AB1898_23130 [Acidobacteriota bacterium]
MAAVLLAVACWPVLVLCQPKKDTLLTQAQGAFVNRYVEALRERDFEKHKGMVHPACRACYTPDNEDFYRDMFHRRLWPDHWPAPGEVRATIQELPSEKPEPGTALRSNCPDPTHVIQLDFSSGPFKSATVLVNVAAERGSWFEVPGCPTAEILQKFRAKRKQQDAETARAETLFSTLNDPLLGKLKALLKEGRKVSAITRYRDVSGEDLSMAKRVVELLERVVPPH